MNTIIYQLINKGIGNMEDIRELFNKSIQLHASETSSLEFLPLARLILEFKMNPVIISESKDSQDIDSFKMKSIIDDLKMQLIN